MEIARALHDEYATLAATYGPLNMPICVYGSTPEARRSWIAQLATHNPDIAVIEHLEQLNGTEQIALVKQMPKAVVYSLSADPHTLAQRGVLATDIAPALLTLPLEIVTVSHPQLLACTGKPCYKSTS